MASGSLSPPVPIARKGTDLPSRVIYHGVEGVGKTSFAAQAPKPIFIMTRGETGLLTLIDNGLIQETEHFKPVDSWLTLMQCLDYLLLSEEASSYRTLVIDTMNGAERLCFEHLANSHFKGWEAFMSYGRGPDMAQEEWIKFLTLLDKVRETRRLAIICLTHTKVKTFKNPEGDDYDRYTPDMHEKTWGLSHKWADVVLFGNYETFAKKNKGELKAKAVQSTRRLFYTQRTAAWDAKNRLNLPAEIEQGNSASDAWRAFFEAAKAGRRQLQQNTTPTN